MRNTTHAALTYTIVTLIWNPSLAPLAALGSTLPDIDHPDSLPNAPLRVILGRDKVKTLSERLGGHRGALHYPYPWAALTTLAWTTGHPWATALTLGALLHVTEDSLTTMGIPVAKGRRIALTGVPSERWDGIALPATLVLLPCAWLAAPSTFPDPGWQGYWTARCQLDSIFIHDDTGWKTEANRMTRYGFLPYGRWTLEDGAHVHGVLTPYGWIVTSNHDWIPTRGSVTGEHVRPVRGRARITVVHGLPPKGSLALEGRVAVKRGSETIPAVLRGFRVVGWDRNEEILECHGLTWKTVTKSLRSMKIEWGSFVALRFVN